MSTSSQSSPQFTCQICGQGFEQKSKLERHVLTSHPEPAPSAADVEKALAGIRFPKSKNEIINYISSRQGSKVKEKEKELFDLIKSLPERTYRDSVEVAIAIGEIKSGRKKIRSSKEVESSEPPSKKGGRIAVTLSISAATLAKALSGIDLPQSKENLNKYINKNIDKMDKDIQSEILNVFEKLPKKDYKDMADIEKEISKIL
jgi:ubiquinone biosynthesis protein COQ9